VTLGVDETHAPELQSWVESANAPTTDFPIQNLPLGCFRRDGLTRPGVALGDEIVDLAIAARLLDVDAELRGAIDACLTLGALNPLLRMGRHALRRLRGALSASLRAGPSGARAHSERETLLVPMEGRELVVPLRVGDYTDFYASLHHATNVGSMFRPDNPLLPNYKWVPIGYHGRASSIVASGTDVRRPSGQTREDPAQTPSFGPSRRLDYELELGAVVAKGNTLGTPVPIARAEEHLAGLCLVNDWSARDIQAWEYQPLGPFLSKSFATTISPWIVMVDALAPFRVPAAARNAGDPAPLPYLDDAADQARGAFDIELEVFLSTRRMRDEGHAPYRVSTGNFATMYWTLAQLVAHHTSNGCNLQPGDLLGSGTVSGAAKESRGCLLERTWRGTEPLLLPTGEERRFLEDGDEVIMRAACSRAGWRRIGFGECRGTISG